MTRALTARVLDHPDKTRTGCPGFCANRSGASLSPARSGNYTVLVMKRIVASLISAGLTVSVYALRSVIKVDS
jgi:hypothetical protein